jgi:restriction system protein
VAFFPWWVGVSLAVLAYVWLHSVANQELVLPTQAAQMGTMAPKLMWRAFATWGQYILPVIFFAGAFLSWWRRRNRQTLVADVAQAKSSDALNNMSWQQFEQLVSEGFRLQGYQVTDTGGGGADGGMDLVARRNGEKYLIQCKQWRAHRVGVEVVRELYGLMAAEGAAGGFVVTSGRFTEEAKRFASGRNVKLVDGPALHGLIRQAQAVRPGADARVKKESVHGPQPAGHAETAPSCPVCSKPMVKRRARRGANAGGEFWGCTGYPECKGTRGLVSE